MVSISIVGVGIDVLDISRMERLVTDEAFLTRVFTAEERAYIRARKKGSAASAAGFFAAKEALFKALGTGITKSGLPSAGVTHLESGQPVFCFSGELAETMNGLHVHLSISHSDTVATALVVLERRDGNAPL
ncbi:holo-ACP synthase [Oscillospiraceae bacterium OttesenSCG-928-G22]|nr:holo-ACP synthase [Oscillospiraceae bacterium OttesenSCG-928-G22]